MSDHFIALIRTYVPLAVGSALTWLAATLGIVLDGEPSTSLVTGVTALFVAAYYAVARVLERRWPVFGILLGRRAEPTYLPPSTTYQAGPFRTADRR